MNRRKILLVIVAILVLALFFVGVNSNRGGRGPARDTGGDPYVTIKGDNNRLYDLLIYDDYRAVSVRLADFVVSQGGTSNGTNVIVTDVKPPYRGNGTVTTFRLSIPSLGIKNRLVSVDITDTSSSTFSVQGTDFDVGLYTGDPVN